MLERWLATLRTEHAALAADVLERQRFFWLGSGISWKEAPNLDLVMLQVLRFLQEKAVSGPDAGAHSDALRGLLGQHLPAEVATFDADPASWTPPSLASIRNAYSSVLATRVAGKPSDYLIMEAADVPRRYGDPALAPGPDHLLIAILIVEGVLGELASANWDGLVEAAVRDLSGDNSSLAVHVIASDVRDTTGMAWLSKFHGCAVLALRDPDRYAGAIIASNAQIGRWMTSPEFRHMRDRLDERTRQFRSVILGLSVQDADLLATFTAAAEEHPWPWTTEHPAYVFAEPSLQPSQEDVLENCYGEEFEQDHDEILRRSLFGQYARPLLAALVTHVVVQKLHAALERNLTIRPDILADLGAGINYAERTLVRGVGDSASNLISFLRDSYSVALRTYFGTRHYPAGQRYIPIAVGPQSAMATSSAITMSAADWLAVATSALGRAAAMHRWRLRVRVVDGTAFFEVKPAGAAPVYLAVVRDAEAADEVLSLPAWVDPTRRISIVHAGQKARGPRRSAASTLGGGRRHVVRGEVWLADAGEYARDADDFIANLVTGAGVSVL